MKTKLLNAVMAAFVFFGFVSCAGSGNEDGADAHKIAIAAHRGYWKCAEAVESQNSIASIRVAQEYGFWGTEFDLHLCTDEVILVFHDDEINGKRFDGNPSSDFADITLSNGEKIPTFGEYLEQGAKNPNCMLVCEHKPHPTQEQEDRLLELSITKIKEAGLYDPERIMFISFSKHICDVIAETMPEFTNQYLTGDISPAELAEDGINGLDYHYNVFVAHPEWVSEAHELGMSVNAWTVDNRDMIEAMIDLGVDCITTNEPELVREILKEKGVEEL